MWGVGVWFADIGKSYVVSYEDTNFNGLIRRKIGIMVGFAYIERVST